MKYFVLISILQLSLLGISQANIDFKDYSPNEEYDNIFVQKINGDGNQTTFLIWVKKNVKLHYHKDHTENIYVLEGKAEMALLMQTYIPFI